MPISPIEIIEKMTANDQFSKWMGIEVLHAEPGDVRLKLRTRVDMCNGFGMLHGGITYAFADSCMAFAANTHGKHAVSVASSISHFISVREFEDLFAQSEEVFKGARLANYTVTITNSKSEIVARFQGNVYVKNIYWEKIEDES